MKIRCVAMTFCTLLALVACSDEPAGPTVDVAAQESVPAGTPSAAVVELAAAFQANDIDRMLQSTLSKAAYADLRASLESASVDDLDRRKFAEFVAKGMSPDAVDAAIAQFGPQIAVMKFQIQTIISGIRERLTALPPDRQAQLTALVDGMQRWFQVQTFDTQQIRAAVLPLDAAFKRLDLSTLDAWVALSYEQKLAKLGQLLAGLKESARAFDADLNAVAGSLRVAPISTDGDSGIVRASITLFGATVEAEMPMVRRDGRWAPKAAVEFAEAVVDAHGHYQARSQVAAAMASTSAMRTAIIEKYGKSGVMPAAFQFDALGAASPFVDRRFHDEHGVITVNLRGDEAVNRRIRNYRFTLRPITQMVNGLDQIVDWSCEPAAGHEPRYLPADCH